MTWTRIKPPPKVRVFAKEKLPITSPKNPETMPLIEKRLKEDAK